MTNDWELEATRVVLAILGVLLLRVVSTWDRTQKGVRALHKGFRTLKDRHGIDCDVEDQD